MRRSNRVKWSELWVGLLVMFGFVILVWASLTGGGTSIFENKRHFSAYFENVQGLTPGSPVWISGVEVGNVRSIKFDKSLRKIHIVGRVKDDVWHLVSSDSKAKIGSIGLIGDKFLEIIPGDPSVSPLEDNGVLDVIEDDIGKVFREGSDAITSVNKIAKSLSEILEKINNGENSLGRMLSDDSLYSHLNSTLSSLSETVDRFNSHQDKVFENLEDVIALEITQIGHFAVASLALARPHPDIGLAVLRKGQNGTGARYQVSLDEALQFPDIARPGSLLQMTQQACRDCLH